MTAGAAAYLGQALQPAGAPSDHSQACPRGGPYFGAISTVIVMTAVSLTVTGAGNGAQALLPNLKRVVPCGHVREGELTLVVLTAWNGCSVTTTRDNAGSPRAKSWIVSLSGVCRPFASSTSARSASNDPGLDAGWEHEKR
jgi:hypothetical protein